MNEGATITDLFKLPDDNAEDEEKKDALKQRLEETTRKYEEYYNRKS